MKRVNGGWGRWKSECCSLLQGTMHSWKVGRCECNAKEGTVMLFVEKGDVDVVDDFEAITKTRLNDGIVGRMQASAMTMLRAGRKYGIYKCYLCPIRARGVEYRLDQGSLWSGLTP